MPSHKVVVTDQVFPAVEVERALLAEIDAELVVADGTREGALAEARDADALLNTYLPIDADAVASLERCRVIARYGIGVDNVDLEAAASAGITVTNVPDYCVEEVATHTLAMLLALLRRIPDGDRLVRAGEWGVAGVRPLHRLSELEIGIVGLGRIGRRVAELLRPTGCRLLGHDPFVERSDELELVGVDELLERSHAVSLHLPLTPDTRGMMGAEQFARMRSDAVLVNTSRGPLVDLDAATTALRDGTIAAAALDVFEMEPVDVDRVVDVPNLLMTPHVAYYSEEAIRESQTKAATQIIRVLSGQDPDYRVN